MRRLLQDNRVDHEVVLQIKADCGLLEREIKLLQEKMLSVSQLCCLIAAAFLLSFSFFLGLSRGDY